MVFESCLDPTNTYVLISLSCLCFMVCMLAMVLASSNLTQSCFDHMFYFNVLFVHVLAIIKYICLSWWPLSAIKRLERVWVFLAKLGKGKGKEQRQRLSSWQSQAKAKRKAKTKERHLQRSYVILIIIRSSSSQQQPASQASGDHWLCVMDTSPGPRFLWVARTMPQNLKNTTPNILSCLLSSGLHLDLCFSGVWLGFLTVGWFLHPFCREHQQLLP